MSKKKKNLCFIFADQWRAHAMGYAKEDPVITPNMDRFCEESCYADHAFSTFPVCSPHRASLMTGKYPLSCGFFTNCKTGLSLRLKDEEICIGDVLSENNYDTAYIGKWHLDEPEINHSDNPISGARDWDAYTAPGVRRHGFKYWYSYGTINYHMHPHYWMDTAKKIEIDEWSPKHETDKAIEYIENIRDKDKPFALYISWNPPHSDYDQVPEKYIDMYKDMDIDIRENVSFENIHHHTGEKVNYSKEEMIETTKLYYAAVTGLDDQFGRIVNYLKENDLYDDTIIVLSADHGDMMGSHGLMGKHVWYEESLRIPFVVHVPGNEKSVMKTCMGSQDMMPTVLGLLGIDSPNTVEGIDCSQYIIENKEDLNKHCFLTACPGRECVVRKFEAAGKDPKAYGWRGLRTQDYTYICELGYEIIPHAKRYLYCLATDPLEMHPLDLKVEKNLKLAKEFESEIKQYMKEHNDVFLPNWLKCAD